MALRAPQPREAYIFAKKNLSKPTPPLTMSWFLIDGPIRANRFADSHESVDPHESLDGSQIA